jgi:uncharacterized protein (UPF0276 family)
MNSSTYPVEGAGRGLRRALLSPLRNHDLADVDFMEVSPENWINVGGQRGRAFREFTARRPFLCHGLSLSLGGPAPLDETFLKRLRQFLDEHEIVYYSEHLSYCTDDGHLYDLFPIPFTGEAVDYVAKRIRQAQNILGRRIAIENVSYYASISPELTEIEFINAVLEEADCDLLLDVNNIYVNSINHGYDAIEFLHSLPGHRIAYGHIAGHMNEAEDLIIDSHGAKVIPSVWELLESAYQAFGVFPTLLERDLNIPPIEELMAEVRHIAKIQTQCRRLGNGESRLKQA